LRTDFGINEIKGRLTMTNETSSFVWLIGGSEMSVPMCEEIKRRGYKLLLTDGDPDCHCKRYADFFHTLDVYDVRDHLQFARSSALTVCQIAAVLTIGTDAGPTVSALSEHFNLPGIGQKTAERVKHKGMMREILHSTHPLWVHFILIENPTAVVNHWQKTAAEAEKFSYPAVVKVTNQQGSRGFSVCNNEQELLKAIMNCSSNSFLIEEYLQGEDIIPEWRNKYGFDTSEAAFDFFVEDGKVILANGALRLFWVDQPGIEAGHINPFEADERVIQLAQEAADGLGVTWGVLKIDVKKDRRYGWCLLECASRLSGGWDHCYTSGIATGRDVTGVMLDVALGGNVDRSKLENRKKLFACAYAPRFPPGKIDGWRYTYPKQSDYEHVFVLVESEIKPLEVNQDRSFVMITKGATADGALEKAINQSGCYFPKYSTGTIFHTPPIEEK
jgi:hypothetical protein